MPYLASNQDASQQESFKTALMGAAVIFGGAALGAGYLSKLGKPAGGNQGSKIAKQLYGGGAKQLSSGVADNISVRTAKDIADSGMSQYVLGKNWAGKERLYNKDKNLLSRFKNNHMNADVKAFNKTLKQYGKGDFGNEIYGRSKATLYQDLYDKTQNAGLGVTSKDIGKMTNSIYDSDINKQARAAQKWSQADDIRLTNSLWGDYSGTASGAIDNMYNGINSEIDDMLESKAAEEGRKIQRMSKAERKANQSYAKKSGIKDEQAYSDWWNSQLGAQEQAAGDVIRAERARARATNNDPMADPSRAGRFERAQELKRQRAVEHGQNIDPMENRKPGRYQAMNDLKRQRANANAQNVDPLANKQPGSILEAQGRKRQRAMEQVSNLDPLANKQPGGILQRHIANQNASLAEGGNIPMAFNRRNRGLAQRQASAEAQRQASMDFNPPTSNAERKRRESMQG